MKPQFAAQAGTFESSDAIVLVEPLNTGDGRKTEISSSVMLQYGENIKLIVNELLNQYQMEDIHLIIKDKGALELTIRARIETALKRSLGLEQGTMKES